MNTENQKLCDVCHERPATCFICVAGPDTTGSRSLCEVCMQQEPEFAGFQQRMQDVVRAGHCKYCGAPADSASCSSSSSGGKKVELSCKACDEDLAEFHQRPENSVPDFERGDEAAMERALQQFADLQKREKEYIAQCIRERKSKP